MKASKTKATKSQKPRKHENTKTRKHENRENMTATEKRKRERELTMLKRDTPLTETTERVVHQVIGCCIAVHRELGPGLLESIYRRALCIEFQLAGLDFAAERRFVVRYRGAPLSQQRVDFVVMESVLLEVKAVDRLAAVHKAQVICYLRVTGLRVGLLVNFNAAVIPDGLQRIVL